MAKFHAQGTKVRMSDGRTVCVTTFSTHLDPENGALGVFKGREAMATIIAAALNLYFEKKADHRDDARPAGDSGGA